MNPADKKRILIADPQFLNQATLIGTLKDDYHVTTAQSAEEVCKRLKQGGIDMLLLETSLADGDGFELCRRLKADELTAALPVIFMTTLNTVTAEAKGFAVGAVDYITKPFNAPTVIARIRNQFKHSDEIKELKRLNQLALDANPAHQGRRSEGSLTPRSLVADG